MVAAPPAAIELDGLTRRYGERVALEDVTLAVAPAATLVVFGPNGAGKSTLLKLACGLLTPTAGRITVLGRRPGAGPAQIAKVGYLAQDAPVEPSLSIADHLKLGAHLNPRWDKAFASTRIESLGLDPGQKAGKLSGGQRAQLALTIATSKHPELLLLDEPVASLDPIARRDFLKLLMDTVVEHETSVILSSHLISDLERVCDYLIVLAGAQVRLTGEIEDITAAHRWIVCTRRDADALPAGIEVVSAKHTDRQSTFMVRSDDPIPTGDWVNEPVGLEDLVLTYMEGDTAPAGRTVPLNLESAR
jgi:ABC-2 type transport system ATP-binding protein